MSPTMQRKPGPHSISRNSIRGAVPGRAARTLRSRAVRTSVGMVVLPTVFFGLGTLTGCPANDGATANPRGFENTSDATNGGATLVGGNACGQCHAEPALTFVNHGHAFASPPVQCESCHGPGGSHFRTQGSQVVIDTARIFVDPTGEQTCRECHRSGIDDGSGRIQADGAFVAGSVQWSELKSSGGHANFACTTCHDPHASSFSAEGIRNTCQACHADATMAKHGGKVFRRGDYVEPLTCQSCHMPLASRVAATADPADVPSPGLAADSHTHIFRINPADADYRTFLSDDGTEVRRDGQGRAAVTVDFVCLRCHAEPGLPTLIFSVPRAAEIAGRMHEEIP